MLQLPFTAPALLAPMDRVTDPCFRDLVLARNPPEALGGAFTEFASVNDHELSQRVLRRHLGALRFPAPVGLQLMGADVEAVALTAQGAQRAGAPLIDLNFGCPAKGAVGRCAGSAMLDDPASVEALVRACVDAVDGLPVTAKIRAGGEDDALLEDIAQAVESGGAALLTVHCRTRKEAYRDTANWDRLRRAVAAVSIPVCGNGGVEGHADLARLRAETGCAFVMVGRAAMADPWIFSGRKVGRSEAAAFLLEYTTRLQQDGANIKTRGGRVKQLLRYWTAGGLVDECRKSWLTERDDARLIGWVAQAAGAEPSGCTAPDSLQ